MNSRIRQTLRSFADGTERVTVLTGAGISAESGIPTFRGPEGYWSVGSAVYHPREMATFAMFERAPWEVWKWYLYRLAVCKNAEPNPGHRALVDLGKQLGDRFTLITQNVDGLHLRAGSTPRATFQIHGNVFFMRCSAECSDRIRRIPETLHGRDKEAIISPDDQRALVCEDCGALTRPHVLWFDETYNEKFYRFHSSMDAALRTGLLIVVGTSGATNLPNQVVHAVFRNGGTIIDINIEENPFSSLAQASPGGGFIQSASSRVLPELVAGLTEQTPSAP